MTKSDFDIILQSKLLFIRNTHKHTIILNIYAKKPVLINNDADLYHNYKDDKEDKVSVEVGVTVSLFLLVETHLAKNIKTDLAKQN